METLTLIMPTRGHPEAMLASVHETLRHATLETTRLIVAADDDDEATVAALSLLPARAIPDVRPREDALGAKYNRVLDYPSDVYLSLDDHCQHSTPGFDRLILEAAVLFPDGIGVVQNHLNCYAFSPVQAITARLARKLGWMYPPYFPFWFVDHWVDDVAKLIDRVSFVDVAVNTWRNNVPTRELRDLKFWTALFDAARIVRRRQARAVIDGADFLEADWRKAILRAHHPFVEYRSQWTNDGLRTDAALRERECNSGPGGPRYDRIKAQAVYLLAEWAPAVLAEIEPVEVSA